MQYGGKGKYYNLSGKHLIKSLKTLVSCLFLRLVLFDFVWLDLVWFGIVVLTKFNLPTMAGTGQKVKCGGQGGIFTGNDGRFFQWRIEKSQEILIDNHALCNNDLDLVCVKMYNFF